MGPGGIGGTGGKWWMKIPNGVTPPGIGRGKTVATVSKSAFASWGSQTPAVTAAPPASAAEPRNLRRVMATSQKWTWPKWPGFDVIATSYRTGHMAVRIDR